MKTPITLYSRLALITSVTLVVGYFVVYAAWTSISDVTGWQTLTATLINNILGNLTDINTRVSNFGFSAGNVGIGTSSPTDKLHIFSDMTSGGIEPYFTIKKTHPVTYATRYLTKYGAFGLDTILPAGTSGSAMIRVTWGDQSVGGGGIHFKTNGDNARMFIRQDGNIGIGTINPSVKLHVQWVIKTEPCSACMGTCSSASDNGKIYFNSDVNHFYGCSNNVWKQLDN